MINKKILESKIFLIFIFPFILGCLSSLSFQPLNFTFINFLSLPILFSILLFVKKKTKSKYRKKPFLLNFFFVGYLFGIGFFLAGTYWISNSLTFDENFKYLIPFAVILIPLFLGLFFAVSTLIIGPIIKKDITSIIIFCCVLSFLDYLRGNILTGFPWNLWAYSWSWLPEFLQLLNKTGLYAFNLITIIVFCSPLLLFLKKEKYNLVIFWIVFFGFFSNYIYGSTIINKNQNFIKDHEKNYVNIKVVSPNLELKYNQSSKEIEKILKKLINYSAPNKDKKTIFIWPEGVFAGRNIDDLKNFNKFFKTNFSKNHLIIFGVNSKDKNNEVYNSLVVVNHKFEILYKYNKIKLVPFGEFLPFEKLLSKVGVKKITEGYGSFLKGKDQNIFVQDDLNILPLICYEIIFPNLIQKAEKEVNLIVNISEDAWFGGSIGPYQHFSKAIFRAIERDVFLVRAANKGVSAFINNKGQIIKILQPNETGSIELKVPLIKNSSRNKNDLIFFVLLFTFTSIFFFFKIKNNE